MNRITASFESRRKAITQRLKDGLVTQEKVDALHKDLDLNLEEFVSFQEVKSLAFLHDKINKEEAQTIYFWLGESPTKFNDAPIEVKVVLSGLFQELLSWKIRRIKAA